MKTNLRLVGVSPMTNSFDVATEVNVAALAARVVYEEVAVAGAVSFVVTMSNVMIAALGFTANAPAVALITGVPEMMTFAAERPVAPEAPITVRVASFAVVAPPSKVPRTVIVSPDA